MVGLFQIFVFTIPGMKQGSKAFSAVLISPVLHCGRARDTRVPNTVPVQYNPWKQWIDLQFSQYLLFPDDPSSWLTISGQLWQSGGTFTPTATASSISMTWCWSANIAMPTCWRRGPAHPREV